ncbi:hypothetical protein UC8_01520 [Roseimaritima ulvae]|uniref:Uncharacterized protein n=1 Tax=Roseimaritima ulvae TaxID=980254 RepID=A0A5B9QJQ1_9BACT|nr:hypothetical protein UC8_01520 [Roseimaritima ulvae]
MISIDPKHTEASWRNQQGGEDSKAPCSRWCGRGPGQPGPYPDQHGYLAS